MVRSKHKITGERVLDWVIYLILFLLIIIFVVPLLYVLSASVTPYSELIRRGGFVIVPSELSFDAYKELFSTSLIGSAFKNTLFVTIAGTAINMVLSILFAYPLSKKSLPGVKFLTLMLVFTMMFNGGTIPTYFVVKDTGLLNSLWALIIPGAIAQYNVILLKNYFQSMPDELFEAATIDGAGAFRVLLSIAVPLAKPIIMTVMLLYMVGNWNVFYAGILYINSNELKPLQVVLREILMSSQNMLNNVDTHAPSLTMRMAAIVVTSVPIIMVYPFVQRYFIKGIMVGAVKG